MPVQVVGVLIIVMCYSWTSNNVTGLNQRYCFPVIPWLIYSVAILILLLIDLNPSAVKIQGVSTTPGRSCFYEPELLMPRANSLSQDWMGHFLGGGSILVTEVFICTDYAGFCAHKVPTEVYIFLVVVSSLLCHIYP